ncbi:MAG: glycosyl hydrolase family 15, partial [Saprospiraceae bacterium]|nr:glycosyl hydrolase family 15 [Saprospiraceae bacterium]
RVAVLDKYYAEVKTVILQRQHPITGLLPASTAVTIHGDYRDAWVRDNVYSIIAVWALALAYRKSGHDRTRTYELEKSTTQLMRGLLRSMMQQADKVERFKNTLDLHDALHAKYDTSTGNTVVGDHDWGHLQIDATSIFLLMMTQMISSGLSIIESAAEVDFIQNLIYYIERAYRIPDYGIWERGEKSNVGYVELNASSLGMAKAALTALSGFNLYGEAGDESSIIHVMPDNIALAKITLQSMLPRESSTKETDSALLSIIGFPAFAVTDEKLRTKVHRTIRDKLGGNYGYKRFLRDGHQTVVEDPGRHYYNPEELKEFEHIESEWPIFYAYEYLLALFQGNETDARHFRDRINKILVKDDGMGLIPELFFVPSEHIQEERNNPGSQKRMPNTNVPLVWAQSLFMLGRLIQSAFIDVDDIDPLGLHKNIVHKGPNIQVLALAEHKSLKTKLTEQGVPTEVPDELSDVSVVFPKELAKVFSLVGSNEKIQLTGRRQRRLKSLTTSRLFQINDTNVLCISLFFLQEEFYLAFDDEFLISRFKSELQYIYEHWNQPGEPVVTILLKDYMATGHESKFISFLKDLQGGSMEGLPVRLASYASLSANTSRSVIDDPALSLFQSHFSRDKPYVFHLKSGTIHEPIEGDVALTIEIIDSLPQLEEKLQYAENIYEQIEILNQIIHLTGIEQEVQINNAHVSIQDLVEEIYLKAGERGYWSVVRLASALLGKVDFNLQNSVNMLLARQKIIQVGRAYSDESMIIRPIPFTELMSKIKRFCRDDHRDEVFTQEILIYVGILNKARPDLFEDLLTIRVSYIILLLTAKVARTEGVLQEEALDLLMDMPPSQIQHLIEQVLSKYQQSGIQVMSLESLKVREPGDEISWVNDLRQRKKPPKEGWLSWRKTNGTLSRLSGKFFTDIWYLLRHCKGIIIGDKLDKRNRLDSKLILSDMTPGEKAFHLLIEHLLNKISAPEYRQLTLEAMRAAARFSVQNPDLILDDYLVFDVINGHAVRLAFIARFPSYEPTYHDHKADAWTHFYNLSPDESTDYIVAAFKYLLSYAPEEPMPA